MRGAALHSFGPLLLIAKTLCNCTLSGGTISLCWGCMFWPLCCTATALLLVAADFVHPAAFLGHFLKTSRS